MAENKLIELRKFDNAGTAHIIKAHLESAGIHCMLAGEDSVGFQPILTSPTGGIRLLILEPDLERALAVLAGEDPDEADNDEDRPGNFDDL